MRGLDTIAAGVAALRDRVHKLAQPAALSTLRDFIDAAYSLERIRDTSPLDDALESGLAEEGAEFASVAAGVLSAYVGRMDVCPGGESLRGALLRCLAAVVEGPRPYRAAEAALRAEIAAVDLETWRRGHSGAETSLGRACGVLGEFTPRAVAKRAADEAMRVRPPPRKAVRIQSRQEAPTLTLAGDPGADGVETPSLPATASPGASSCVVSEAAEAKPADVRERTARRFRRGLSPEAGWRPLSSVEELVEWVQW